MRIFELTEYLPLRLLKAELSEQDGFRIYREYGDQIDVEFPTPKTDNKWELVSKGWVGYIPLNPELSISLKPKVALKNIFHMLEYAYRLRSLRFLAGLMACDSLATFYQQLAKILARRVIDRGRKGYYHTYVDISERLAYISGRLDIDCLARTPWRADLWCHYQNHTADVVENQILAWTLRCIARTGICKEEVIPEVRRAYRGLQGLVRLTPFSAMDCVGRLYNRLNDDYEPLHVLCRFFLEHSGPTLSGGEHATLPFLIDMARLYELFVAEWLAEHLPARFYLKPQENVCVGPNGTWSFRIDIVIYDSATGRAWAIADTKYKATDKPSPIDIAQVVTYAKLKECEEAILVYPAKLSSPIDEKIGDVSVRSLTFNLSGDLEKGGSQFMSDLLEYFGN